ncbi:MAG: HAMP domain-containing histidine kinase [Proteobacteria bacterium]|nr:HAMP domain-containing histidine kinase [Pseudomonadota bacterium]
MAHRRSLQKRIQFWLAGYALLLTVAVFVHGYLVNEFAERLIWDSLLETELNHHLQRSREDPSYRWTDTEGLQLYRNGDGRPPPPALAALPDGIHDEMMLGTREVLVLARHVDGARYTLVLDITDLEHREDLLTLFVLGTAVALVLALGLLASLGLRRALRPLTDMAGDIARLEPDHSDQRVALPDDASSELAVIAGALNDYLGRHERFVERERVFIDTASHELRTPMAVIAGALELALAQPGLPAAAQNQVQRAHRTVRDVEQLISLLLVLAKDPGRLSKISDHVPLHELIPEIIDDHRYLTRGKDLVLSADRLAPCTVHLPIAVVQAAIGNLLRNAIENSDQGEIRVQLSADATITIHDPGHGMTPEEISRIYAQIARHGERAGGGIGMDLLGRLCEHLGWGLRIESVPGRGTVSTLALRGTATPPVRGTGRG